MTIALIDETKPLEKSLCRKLIDDSAFICEYLERGLKERKIKYGCSRLNFNCIDGANVRDDLWKCEGLVSIEIPFDSKYYLMNRNDKTTYICYLLECGFKKYGTICNADISPVIELLAELKAIDYYVDFYALKPCRRGEYTAKLYCVQDMEHSNFYVELYHKRKLINKIPFYKDFPDRLGYFFALGRFEWIDDDTVCLYSHPYYPNGNCDKKKLKVK